MHCVRSSVSLLSFVLAFAVWAAEPLNVTNTIDVASGGAVAEPVALHRAVYDQWLADPDYNSWTNYTPRANTHYDYPQITHLVCGEGGSELFLTNLYPGTTYPYTLTNALGQEVTGTFTTAAAAPRWLLVPYKQTRYISNVRDLGGWEIPGGNGRRTSFNVFFRSAALDAYFLDGTDRRGRNPLHSELGINTELDLRGGNNVTTVYGPDRSIIEDETYYFTTNVPTCVVGWGPENAFTNAPSVNDGSIRYFRVAMTTSASRSGSSAEEIRKAFHVLGTKAYHPVLFHCAGGRDRTGFIGVMIQALCGLTEEQIFRDHLSIVFAAMGSMYAERVDGNLRQLLTAHADDGSLLFTQYGDSLAGHARAYLEHIGVTADEIATITQAYVGETPAEVLARVNAYEASKNMRTVTYVSRETSRTNAVHRVGDGDFHHEPLLALAEHYEEYNLVRSGYKFVGWTDEVAIDATHGERYALWEELRYCTVTFVDPFGSVMKSVTALEGTDFTAQAPAAPAGTVITGWDGDLSCVREDLTVTCAMTGVNGYLGSAGTPVSDAKILARGGDAVYAHETADGTEYVHVYTSTNGVRSFTHPTQGDLTVSYLCVGGGGAGGDSNSSYFGAGGGGGGGVAGATAVYRPGETWSILVGAGGTVPGGYTKARLAAQASSISNATAEVACAPGGGAGQCCSETADTMTSGANGGGANSRSVRAGATGTFQSFCDGVTYPLNKGGTSSRATVTTTGTTAVALASGGAGAGGNGGNGTASSNTAGHGGLGVYSSITGELKVYGSGGGAGGGVAKSSDYITSITNDLGLIMGFHPGEGANGGGRGGYGNGTTNVLNQSGANGFGGGAGGARAGSYRTAGTVWGGSGTVILRYVEPLATPALGGDSVRIIETESTTDYVHTFSSTNGVLAFRNVSGGPLDVRYLAGGGGGAGGSAAAGSHKYAAGGGGGGGVTEGRALIDAGGAWSVRVGAGGVAASAYSADDTDGGATSVSNGTAEIIAVPAGGHGGHPNSEYLRAAQEGAAGGGGGAYYSKTTGSTGASGTYVSSTFLTQPAKAFAGGNSAKFYTNETRTAGSSYYFLTGGGGGAGGAGETPAKHYSSTISTVSGAGGIGLSSDITGEVRFYGAGGGGGGMYNPEYLINVTNTVIQGGAGGSGVGGAGARVLFDSEGSPTEVLVAESGLDGSGSGGGGGLLQDPSLGVSTVTKRGGNGGNGVVILRYSIPKATLPTTLAALGNRGEVTYSFSGELVKKDADIYVKPGTTGTLTATDAGGTVCGCWRDDTTGELFWGATVTVTPTDFTRYTACFGPAWFYDATARTVSNGDWTFSATNKSGRALYLISPTASPAEGGLLNLATPVTNAAGTAYAINYLGNAAKLSGSDGLFGTDTKNNHRLKLTTLFLPGKLTGLGKTAFEFCTNLTGTVCIPTNTTLYKYAFNKCYNLRGLVFKGGTAGGQKFDSAGYQFYSCSKLAGDIVLPEGMTALPTYSFAKTAIPSLLLPSTLTSIGAGALYQCTKLTELTVPNGVTSIGAQAALECTKLVDLVLPTGLKTIGAEAFSGCTKLANVANFQAPAVRSVGDQAFWKDSALTFDTLSLPCLTNVNYGAFYQVSIAELNLPVATNVGALAFSSSRLKKVTFGPGAVTFEPSTTNRPYGYGTFASVASACSFHFPGKAPVLKPNGGTIGGYGYTGEPRENGSVMPMFGATDGIRFYGQWRKDPTGWQKIITDGVGTTDLPAEPPTDLEPNSTVKGVFRALRSEGVTTYGWLVDDSPAGLLLLLK